ncbi:branched-chain amino acid transport system permease protein [Methanolinea mesophila]|uniref:branched-chain amino acid ABC transporter permease n=1 Tax=Methanolinea mesophila TaxID=547055 RepID=UPI001AE8AECA|nr:branched-chain amino acid ABC transporter permease [Methanolinea mesophila]MBP1928878.1 branched-chain amino acid transport system permease protein [Methanolinea mesophila]
MEKEKLVRYGILAALAIAVIVPILTGFNAYYLTVMILMLIFIIFASAWNFLTYTGQGSLGHAAFFGIGGYVSALTAAASGLSPYFTIFVGGGGAAIAGVFIAIICVRLKEWFLAMVTFGFAIIVQVLVVTQFATITGGWDGIAAPPLISSSVPGYLLWIYYSILVITVLVIVLFWFILKSRVGLAYAAIRENELEARAAGIDPVRYKLSAFAISAYFAGVAGALEIHYLGYITPEIFGVDISFWPIIYSISGGLGTLAGPVIGTIVITLLWDGLQGLGLSYGRFIIIGVLLVLIIIFLPKGMVSLPDRIREWQEKKKRT